MEIACDRCLEQFNFPVEFDGSLIVKIDASQESDSDEIQVTLRLTWHNIFTRVYT